MKPTMAGVCSGIGGFDLAFARAGARILWACEIEQACRSVLATRFHDLPVYQDMTSAEIEQAPVPQIFVGGTPCQGFSVAGLRKGLNDDRSNLALRFIELCNRFNPEVILWENVPGVLSMADNAFGCFLAGLVGADAPLLPTRECGARWTNAGLALGPKRAAGWRVLDSQYFGLAQRRERVFVVASPRTDLPFQVLFEPEGLRRHSPPRREKRERIAPTLEGHAGRSGANNFATSGGLAEIAPTISARNKGGGGLGTDAECNGALIAYGGNNTTGPIDVATACNAHGGTGRHDFESETFVTFQTRIARNGRGYAEDIIPALNGADAGATSDMRPCVAFRACGQDGFTPSNVAPPIIATKGGGAGVPTIAQSYAIRRLTPRDHERLQGFPDDWTLVPNAKGKPMADGPRCKMLGNAVSIPVAEWLARRILHYL